MTASIRVFASASALALAVAAPAWGQSANPQPGTSEAERPPAASPSTLAAGYDGSAGEIVVTANKREENINKVGAPIAAVSASVLDERNITSLADIAAAVPGLTFIQSANNTPVYNLRGVGFYDTSLGSYPTTSVYLDEVPLSFPVLTNLTAFDLQRIEVLKGPQGTLFGQNSTGGAINYIANKPTDTYEAGIELGFGRFNHFLGNAFLSGPLSSRVRARLALQGELSGPWQRSYTRDDENGRLQNVAGRLLIDWDATETVRFQLNLNGWNDSNEPQAVSYAAFYQQAITNVQPEVRNYPLAPRNPRAADWSENNGMFRDLYFGQAALRADWEFAEDIVLTSITSYIGFTQRGALDQDGINFDGIDLRFFKGDIESFSQELRIANSGQAQFRWIVGANYSRDHVFYRENIVYGDGSGGNNQPAPFQIESSENFSDQNMQNVAVFANGELDFLERFTVKAGIRYTRAERTADICNLDGTVTPEGGPARRNFPPGGANRLFDLLADLLAPGNDYPNLRPGDCFNLNDPSPLNPQANPARPFEPGLFRSSLDEDNVSWRVGLDWRATDTLLLYTNVSKGYKAGGFGNINAAINFQFRPVVQEAIMNYEVGFKAQLLDRRVSVNAAAFYMDYDDKQLRTKDINPIFGIIDALNNVPKSNIKGFEVETNARLFRGFDLGAAATYLESTIDEYTGTSAAGVTADFKGTVIPFTPTWQVGANARYETELSASLSGFAAAQLNYRSESFAAIGGRFRGENLAPNFEIDAFTTVDAQIGVESEQGWRAMLWGKNLTNEYYWTNVVAGQDQIVRYVQRPATYGVTVGYRF